MAGAGLGASGPVTFLAYFSLYIFIFDFWGTAGSLIGLWKMEIHKTYSIIV